LTDRWRLFANLATLGNGLLGVGAILYILAGNKTWAMLLVVMAIGLDGLDGMMSRRSAQPARLFGRVADSVSDAVTFGLAPAFLVAVHTSATSTWAPYDSVALVAAAAYAAAAFARLTYYTARGHERSYFLGVPSPTSALAIIVVILFHDTPAFQTVAPVGVLTGTFVVAILMVVPVPYPKIRRGAPLRVPMAITAIAAALCLVPLQFRPAPGSAFYELAYGAAYVFLVGVAAYYLVGPFTARRDPAVPAPAQA
jgi:phosphatidylserine synthase